MKKYLVVLILFPLIGFSQGNYSGLVEKYMQEMVSLLEFSGVVFIAQKGKVIYKKAFGLANKEWNIPNTLDTKFRIGSNTKQFTAAAVLQLVDEGKLTLDDKLSKFFQGYPKGDSVTIKMLLNHTSGIRNYGIDPGFSSLPLSKDSVIALFRNAPYDFSPGKRWAYNNSAFFLLGCIIEKVTGKSYSGYLEKSVLSKAGMCNSGLNKLDSVLKFRAMGYEKTKSGWQNAGHISMEIPFSSGAMYSTAEDLYKWNEALYSGKIISAKMLKEMCTPTLNHYGLGLRIDSFNNHLRIGHSGSIPGFNAYNVWFPESELSIIILSNNESEVIVIGEDIRGIIYKKVKIVLDPLVLDAFAGTYIAPQIKFSFTRRGNSLRFMDGGNPVELYPISANSFMYGFARRRYFTFIKNEKGKMKLQFTRNAVMSELEKID